MELKNMITKITRGTIIDRLIGVGSLARWLGPWADQSARPEVEVTTDTVCGVKVSRARGGDRGKWIVAPGLHFGGPEDPRMVRFISVLAAAGYEVVAPHIRDYQQMRVRREPDGTVPSVEQFCAVVEAESKDAPVFLFSISFGSLLVLRAATRYPERVSEVVTFGGFVDVETTVLFTATGKVGEEQLGKHDPLNLPVLYLHLLDELGAHDPEALGENWRSYIRATWNRPEIRDGVTHLEIGRAMVDQVNEEDRELFLLGIGNSPEGRQKIVDVWPTVDFSYMDTRPYLHELRAPLHIMHGADDDVIPVTEAAILARCIPAQTPVKSYITGMYTHTTSGLPSLENVVDEGLTMVRMLFALTPSRRSSTGVA